MLNSRHSQPRLVFVFNDRILLCSCYSWAEPPSVWSPGSSDNWSGCRVCFHFLQYVCMLGLLSVLAFHQYDSDLPGGDLFLFWTSSELKSIGSRANKSGAVLQLKLIKGWENDIWLTPNWIVCHISQQLSLLLLTCVKYFLLIPLFLKAGRSKTVFPFVFPPFTSVVR